MQTHLYLHQEHSGTPQAKFRGRYELRHVAYELWRETNHKGDVASELQSSEIHLVIKGFADTLVFAWLFDPYRKEDGEIVSMNSREQVIEKLKFEGAAITDYRMHYDSRVKEGLVTLLTIKVKRVSTDNDLYNQSK